MRKILSIFGLLLAGLILLAGPAAAWGGPMSSMRSTTSSAVATSTSAELTAQEKADLQFMVEEEKLARDVYLYLYEKWGLPVFKKIAKSEQKHMDTVSILLDKYGVENPAVNEPVGVFQNEELQELYYKLTEQGSQSVEAALMVGALIEEKDIADLQERIANTDKEDIKQVYSNLMAGSENHLRVFVGQLESMGVTYTGQVLPQEQVDEILSSAPARGMNVRSTTNTTHTPRGHGAQEWTPMHSGFKWNPFTHRSVSAFQRAFHAFPI